MTIEATEPDEAMHLVADSYADKGLKKGALGLISSTVIGVASTAPAYSLAATLGFVVVVIGPQAPIVTILAFIPILLTSFAYRELNRADPDCGTTFTWATRAFGPKTGWMGGWGIVAEMPHGGFKHSGYGKDLSSYGFEDYTRIKHVMSYIGE